MPSKAPPRTNDLLAFMKERHNIYLKRAKGTAKPWTKDQILQSYRFCNVYRELDTVTIWVRENIREPFADHPNLWFMLAMARQINWPDTLQEIMDEGAWPRQRYDWAKVRAIMLARQGRGDQLYTGAYMLNAHGTKPSDPKDKAFFTTKLVLNSVWEFRSEIRRAFENGSMRQAWASLLPSHGWGPFTAYEVVCDARYTRYGATALWDRDAHAWANAGPGAKRGLNRLTGAPLKQPMRAEEALRLMRAYFDAIAPRWSHEPKLEMREIEHCLCEFDKYERTRLNEGRPRSTYPGV
jgi:alpha-glutamyl/putrescinyl thymine pyrophosphorylase clade 1